MVRFGRSLWWRKYPKVEPCSVRAVSSFFTLSLVSVNFQPSVRPSFLVRRHACIPAFSRATLALHIKLSVVPLYSGDVYSLPVMLTVSFGAVSCVLPPHAADKLQPWASAATWEGNRPELSNGAAWSHQEHLAFCSSGEKNKPTVNHDITVILEARARPCPVITCILSNCILGNRRKSQTEGGVDEGEFESFRFVP